MRPIHDPDYTIYKELCNTKYMGIGKDPNLLGLVKPFVSLK
jgi:hypothetical protein